MGVRIPPSAPFDSVATLPRSWQAICHQTEANGVLSDRRESKGTKGSVKTEPFLFPQSVCQVVVGSPSVFRAKTDGSNRAGIVLVMPKDCSVFMIGGRSYGVEHWWDFKTETVRGYIYEWNLADSFA